MRKWVRRISYVFLTLLVLAPLGALHMNKSGEPGMPINCLHESDRRLTLVDAL